MRDARALVLLLATLVPVLSSCAPGHSFFTRGHAPAPRPLAAPRGASSLSMGFVTSHILSGIAASRIAASAVRRHFASFGFRVHPGGNPGANLKSISHRCHPILVAFVWELTKETINLPLGCPQGGRGSGSAFPGKRRDTGCWRCSCAYQHFAISQLPSRLILIFISQNALIP
jgi:hypothetical protein